MGRHQRELPAASGHEVIEDNERLDEIVQAVGHEAVADTVERPEITKAKHDLADEAIEQTGVVVPHEESGAVVVHETPQGELVQQEDGPGGAVVPYEEPNLPVRQTPEEAPVKTPEQPLVMGEVGQDHDVERKAHELASRLIEEKEENNAKRKFYDPRKAFRRIWGYENRLGEYTRDFKAKIKESGSLHGIDDKWTDEQRAEFEAVEMGRMLGGPEEAIDQAAGEKRQYFDDDHEAVTKAKDLLAEFASSDMSDDEFLEKMEDVRAAMGEGETASNEMFMSNYLEVAQAARGRLEQDESMESVLEGFKLVRAEARSDTRAEIHKSKIDALVDKWEDSRFGRFIPANAVGLGINIAVFAADRGSRSIVGRLFSLGGSAALAGTIAGLKTHSENNRLRSNMMLNQGRGAEYSSESARSNRNREAISEYEYKQVESETLIGGLHDVNARFATEEMSDSLAHDAINQLSNLQALKEVSVEKSVELIGIGTTDDPNKRAKDRLVMGSESAGLKAQMAEAVRNGDTHILGVLGLDTTTDIESRVPVVDGETPEQRQAKIDGEIHELINHAISLRSEAFAERYRDEVDSTDKAWAKYNTIDSAKEGLKVAGMSLVAGVVIQEVMATMSSGRSGLLERAWGAKNNPDAQNTLLNHFGGHQYNTEHITKELSPSEIRDIQSRGGIITDNSSIGQKGPPMQQSMNQFVQGHKGEMTHFNNVNLYTNDTGAAPDLNELGGALGKGPDGTVKVFAEMTKNGSFEGANSIDMTNSPNVFTMAFKQPDGTHIHKVFNFGQEIQKPWADMLAQDSSGNWSFKGDGYIAWGQTNNGTLEVAASMAGTGQGATIEVPRVPENVFSYDVSYPASGPTEMPPAAWVRAPRSVGVTSRPPRAERPPEPEPTPEPLPQLEPAPVRPELETAPVRPELESASEEPQLERAKSTEVQQRDENLPEQQEQLPEIESRGMQIAREAGWPLLELQIGSGNASAEQWKAAASVVEQIRAANPNVTSEIEQLRLAVELAETTNVDAEIRGMLMTLYRMNEHRQERHESGDSDDSAGSEQGGTGTPVEPEPASHNTNSQGAESAPRVPENRDTEAKTLSKERNRRIQDLDGRIDESRRRIAVFEARGKGAEADKGHLEQFLLERSELRANVTDDERADWLEEDRLPFLRKDLDKARENLANGSSSRAAVNVASREKDIEIAEKELESLRSSLE